MKKTCILIYLFTYVTIYSINFKQKDEDKHYQFAKNLFLENKYLEATESFKDFISIYEHSLLLSNVYFYMAKIEYQNQNYEIYINYLDKIFFLEMHSNRGLQALYDKANILDILGQTKEAIKILDYIIKVSPGSHLQVNATSKKQILKKLEKLE